MSLLLRHVFVVVTSFICRCFKWSMAALYKLLTLTCGCWSAMLWGLVFGCSTFFNVYWYWPTVYWCGLFTYCIKGSVGASFQCLCGPVLEISWLMFENVRLQKRTWNFNRNWITTDVLYSLVQAPPPIIKTYMYKLLHRALAQANTVFTEQ